MEERESKKNPSESSLMKWLVGFGILGGLGAVYLLFLKLDNLVSVPPRSGSTKKMSTPMFLDSLDAALERFRMDFNAYPSLQGDGKAHSGSQWETISRALASYGASPSKTFSGELVLVLKRCAPKVDVAHPAKVDLTFNGPYIKTGPDGVKRDGWSRHFGWIANNKKGAYLLYSFGPNGMDEHGMGDDLVSNGSQLPYPTP